MMNPGAVRAMKVPFVDLHAQYQGIKSEIDAAIAEVIAESAFVRGPQVEISNKPGQGPWACGIVFPVPMAPTRFTSPCAGCRLKPGDEVITTAHSWIATSETITQAGGRVVFCDTDYDTFTINPALIEAKITSRTVGIIPVHLYGQSADMDSIMADCGEAQALGDRRLRPGAHGAFQRPARRHFW